MDDSRGGDERFLVRGVPWHAYVTLRDSLDRDGTRLFLTYREGDLELMRPSPAHEELKKLLAYLLEVWCDERGIELFAHGATTYGDEAVKRGLEADESYSIGTRKSRPDLAIEVVVSSVRIDKKDVYRGLGVEEVRIFQDGKLAVHRLDDSGGYRQVLESGFLPGLDLALLARLVRPGASLGSAARALREALRSGRAE